MMMRIFKTQKMKTKIIVFIALMMGFIACENKEVEFDDYGLTAVYFPFQSPARSLILGKYDVGVNDNDNQHKFEIGVTMTGVYSNDKARKVHFELAPELLDSVANVQALPANYYNIETASPVTIPAGSLKGRITVQLTDAFFDDTLSFAPVNVANYAIPLVITDIEGLDTFLVGLPETGVSNPLRVKAGDWKVKPKDYTLFGIKFINKYEANYLRRGQDDMTTASNELVMNVYHEEYVEYDEVLKLTTTGRNAVEFSTRILRGDQKSPGDVNIELAFDNDNNCSVKSFGNDPYNVSGTGKLIENGDSWAGNKYDVIHLDYTFTDAANNEVHNVMDTLVVRNRGVIFEEFPIELN